MVKLPYSSNYTDSDEEETSSRSSITSEKVKKKKRFSILKYTNGNAKKKKCKVHSKSEPEEIPYTSSSRSKVKPNKLPGILKHPKEKEVKDTRKPFSYTSSASEDEDESESASEPAVKTYNRSRCLVGRVPRPAGSKPGRGGGVALIVKKNVSSVPPPQISSSSNKRARFDRQLTRKRSY